MKKTSLMVILICLIIFVSSMTAGILLTIKTVGWSELIDSSRWIQKMEQFVDNFPLENLLRLNRQTYTVDDLQKADLTQINCIKITAVAENIQIKSGSDLLEARLRGSYRSFGRQIHWRIEKQGDQLHVYADYPYFSLISSQLEMLIQIPETYQGEVQVTTVSGSCDFPDHADYQWTRLQFSSTSGSLMVANAAMPVISAKNVSGNIDIRQCAAKVTGKTVSGDISVIWSDFYESGIETVSGDVALALPLNASCRLNYTTVSGGFSNLGLPIQISEQLKRRLSGEMNQGQESLTVRTVSGTLIMSSP